MSDVVVADQLTELDLESDDAVAVSFDDEIDPASAPVRAEMSDASSARLRVDLHRESHQGFEERTEQRAIAGYQRSGGNAFQQSIDADAEQSRSESRIGKVVLRRGAKLAKPIPRRQQGIVCARWSAVAVLPIALGSSSEIAGSPSSNTSSWTSTMRLTYPAPPT